MEIKMKINKITKITAAIACALTLSTNATHAADILSASVMSQG